MQLNQRHISLQNRLGYIFIKPQLLKQALTHRSHSGIHNERLEFLGDSILNCVIASILYDRYAFVDEGDLSRLRANLVKQQALFEIAQRIELSEALYLGEGELKSGGFKRPSILADTMEALFGAVYIDSGFDKAKEVIEGLYQPTLTQMNPETLGKDAKTLLQEKLQAQKYALPLYAVVATRGAAHSQEFEVECTIPELEIKVNGIGISRRAAEQAAAKQAIVLLDLESKTHHQKAVPIKKVRARKQQLKLDIATEQAPPLK
jgi:ribonuclease III